MQNPHFRTDINALRGWAVAAVVLYHFQFPWLSGGFAGVDVFFVISGYLMAGIIVRRLERGGFSLTRFLADRCRRIIPALLAMLALLLVGGTIVLTALDLKGLAAQIVSAVGFASNLKFFSESGYFDASSTGKWLLHTWSLGVEWQFYLLLPLVALAVWHLAPGRRPLRNTLLTGMGLSALACLLASEQAPAASFFLLPFRAWEMLAGAVVALRASEAHAAAQAAADVPWQRLGRWLAAVALGFTLIGFDSSTPWPSWRAMVPVASTALLLAMPNPNTRWISSPLIQWLGTRSYSIYLWHWPVRVAAGYFGESSNPLWVSLGSAVLSLVLADRSYAWIEQTTQQARSRQPSAVETLVGYALLSGLLVVPAVAAWLGGGWPGRFPPLVSQVELQSENFNPRRKECHASTGSASPSCQWGSPTARVIVVGDSHASALVTGIADLGAAQGAGVIQWSYSGCAFVLGQRELGAMMRPPRDNGACAGFVDWAMGQLEQKPADMPVVIVNRYAAYAFGDQSESAGHAESSIAFLWRGDSQAARTAIIEHLSRNIVDTACRLSKSRRVYLTRPIPEMPQAVPIRVARQIAVGLPGNISVTRSDYLARNGWVWRAQDEAHARCGAIIVDPTQWLCKDDQCDGSRNGWPLYSDDDHLSEFGNRIAARAFSSVFADMAAPK